MLPGRADVLSIPYEATDFPPTSRLNGKKKLGVGWNELLWASITVGKAQQDIFRFGTYSFAELVHRVACFHAYYRVENGRLELSSAFADLDPTEKGIVSFYTGMAMVKLYAANVLRVPWLMHISRYAAPWAVRYAARADRPDLFGPDVAGRWVVAEAKGRSRVTSRLVAKMKHQKSAVATINGTPPAYRFGSATRIEARRLSLRVVDPPARRRAEDLSLDAGAWLIDYYRPIVDLIEQAETRRDEDFIFGQLPGSDIEIGVAQDTMQVISDWRERQFERPGPQIRRRADIGLAAERPLAAQTGTNNRDVVERLAAGALRGREVRQGFADGLIVRARHG